MNESARAMLADFRAHYSGGVGLIRELHENSVAAWSFGMDAARADELADLVVAGTKRATATSAAALRASGEPPPQVGQYSIILDGSDTARCIIRTDAIREGPLNSVTNAFAWREGEGDRSRACWLADHTRCFTAEHAELGLEMHEEIPVLFEEFVVVWPLELADR